METTIKKYKFRKGLPQEIEILDLKEIFSGGKKFLTKPHRTNFYHIFWFQKGTPTHIVDFVPITIKPNTLLFLNQDVVHLFDAKGDFEGKLIIFTEDFFCQTKEDFSYLRNSILFYNLFSVTQIQTENNDCIFGEIFQSMEQAHNTVEVKKSQNLDYVLAFRDLLEEKYKVHKQVSYFAKEILITEKKLSLATKSVLGKTPKELIDARIILEAKRLLSHTTESVKEIGYELGFEEPTNFIKYFRKHNQTTPTQFRDNLNLEFLVNNPSEKSELNHAKIKSSLKM